MALTSNLKPDGFRPVGAGRLDYTFTEGASISGKPNYRVEIELNGLGLPVFQFRPDSALNITCNIAPLLRSVLTLSDATADRLKSTYVKYQAVWDGGSDAQVPLSSNLIYFYAGVNNLLNKRTQFEITTSAGSFLLRDSLKVWTGRTAFIEFLNGITAGWVLVFNGTRYWGSGNKELVSIPITAPVAGVASLYSSAWALGTSAADNSWLAITYAASLFVAVANSGVGNRVMTSPDGATWTIRTSAANNSWGGIAYGATLFVAVSSDGANRVMTSPDAITWTSRSASGANTWVAVAFGNSIFVATALTAGAANQVMTSPDGITWTGRTAAADRGWPSVTYGAGLFVAVTDNGAAAGQVMTSPDGITWTSRTAAAAKQWRRVAYGNGLFVAVAIDGTTTDIMTSPDGITWTSRTSDTSGWLTVAYGDGMFVATSSSGGKQMASNDGINWIVQDTVADRDWKALAYGNSRFVAVGNAGTGDRAMYIEPTTVEATLTLELEDECANPIYLKWLNDYGGLATRLFDYNQILNIVPSDADGGRFKKVVVFLQSISQEEWLDIMELNRPGAEFGDNQKLGAFVQDYTDEDDPIDIFVEPAPAATATKARGNNAQLTLRYPLLENMDAST